ATPEIGLRCAFTPVVNHFDPDFLAFREQFPQRIHEGDTITQVGDQRVQNWTQLLRTLLALRDQTPETVPDLHAEDLLADKKPVAQKNYLNWDGNPIVRVRYERDGVSHSVWCRVGPTPVETLLPTVLWFLLKIGLFVVGAIVFWQRPDDRSAGQFFLVCSLSLGAYIGGYHWWRI